MPTDEQLSHFYAHEYRQHYHGEVSPSPRRIMRAWQNAQLLYHRLADHVPRPSRVVDIGAGVGCTVRYFAEQGFAASGIEPHCGFQRFAVRHLGASVEHKDLFDVHDRHNADLVLLVHVIEHFRSPTAALLQIGRLLTPSGMLYMECPNLAAPFALPSHLFHFAHIHNFTPRTLDAMAAKVGLQHVVWLNRTDDPNIAGLWRLAQEPRTGGHHYEGSYAATMAALNRYNWLTYHLRFRYLGMRLVKVANAVYLRLHARRFVARLLEQSQRPAPLDLRYKKAA